MIGSLCFVFVSSCRARSGFAVRPRYSFGGSFCRPTAETRVIRSSMSASELVLYRSCQIMPPCPTPARTRMMPAWGSVSQKTPKDGGAVSCGPQRIRHGKADWQTTDKDLLCRAKVSDLQHYVKVRQMNSLDHLRPQKLNIYATASPRLLPCPLPCYPPVVA